MRIGRPLLKAGFIARENRFRARVRLAGEDVAAHVPNSGRLRELCDALQVLGRAAVVFVIQRDDARAFATHDASDPAFGAKLREVAARGVEVYAYTCRATSEEVVIHKRAPVLLDSL